MADDDSDNRWWAGALGPGFEVTSEDPLTYERNTTVDGWDIHEVTTIDPDGSSLWIKTRAMDSAELKNPNEVERESTTTSTLHAPDGQVVSTSSKDTSEYITHSNNGTGRNWFTTITDEDGNESHQQGVSLDGRLSGSEVVKTVRSDGTTRQDTVTWSGASSDGERVTVELDADGQVISTGQDSVIRNDDGNWEHDPTSPDEGPGDDPVVPPGGDDGDDGDGEGGGGGDFGPGGPDGEGPSGGDDGGDGSGEDGDDGPGPPRPPGPAPDPDPAD